MKPTDLAAAYRATAYFVALPEGDCELRVDAGCERLDRWLAANGYACWAWLTAVNPASRALPAAANAARLRRLRDELAALGHRSLPARAIADAGDWPAEESCWVPGLDAPGALALARRFGQNACLVGTRGQPARLVWVE